MDSSRIGSTWRAETPAKLNLFLEVICKRDDGFHEIETLMVAVSLYDTLYFTGNQDGIVDLTARWGNGMEASAICSPHSQLEKLPPGSENTVSRALDLLRQAAGITAGASIRLIKRIPSAAGLGGASSDAAAALIAANRAWGVDWPLERLSEIGAQIGSDIPFFLSDSGTREMAICRGRGERVSTVPYRGQIHFVVIRPPVGMATAQVYSRCRPARQPHSIDPLLAAVKSADFGAVGRQLFNRLEATAIEISPWIQRLQLQLGRLDLPGFGMSGSGSSFFGICRHHRHAHRVARMLRTAGVGQVFSASSASSRCRLAAVSN